MGPYIQLLHKNISLSLLFELLHHYKACRMQKALLNTNNIVLVHASHCCSITLGQCNDMLGRFLFFWKRVRFFFLNFKYFFWPFCRWEKAKIGRCKELFSCFNHSQHPLICTSLLSNAIHGSKVLFIICLNQTSIVKLIPTTPPPFPTRGYTVIAYAVRAEMQFIWLLQEPTYTFQALMSKSTWGGSKVYNGIPT